MDNFHNFHWALNNPLFEMNAKRFIQWDKLLFEMDAEISPCSSSTTCDNSRVAK